MNYHFNKGKFTEAELEKAILTLFEQEGYEIINGETLHRKFDEVLMVDDLKEFLNKKYKEAKLTETEINKIISKLSLIPFAPLYLGNLEAYRIITEGFDFKRDDPSQLPIHISFIDFETNSNNTYKAINQFEVQGEHRRRPDLLIFINGIPVAIFEFKTAIEESKAVVDAHKQITIRYNRDIPKLMKYCFLSVISDGANTKMGSIFSPYEYYFSWNKANNEEKVSNGISSLLTMVKGAFAIERILAILRDFIFYPDESEHNTAIITRYPQFFAANAMLESIKAHMRPNGDGKGGTYFGATGCGKTYTMLFLARLLILRDRETFNNPTIIILTDREDLDNQTSELFVTAKKYLHEADVRSIESRSELKSTLSISTSGGVYITTIQKFCEATGLLSERNNIICISDEAHRTQTGVAPKTVKTKDGVYTKYGFAKFLRDSFPNATYCGFTGTPIDETISVFGEVVDSYTMKESTDDGITVRISYEPRLARVILSQEQAKEIQQYYNKCAEEGSTEAQIEDSKRAMTKMKGILAHPERVKKLAFDIVNHYEALCNEKPEIVQKAMIVCADRPLAFNLIKEIVALKSDWGVAKKAENEEQLDKETLDKLKALPKINLVATRQADDPKELYDLCGTKGHRKMLDKQFKNETSNFKIAVVVDMWITGFDVPSLAVMYIDKPLQKHTLIQTISRVNRVFDGKDKGLVVDYIGIEADMMEAVKRYGSPQESPIEQLDISLSVFRNHLVLIDEALFEFDDKLYFTGEPFERLMCLNRATEFVQQTKELEMRFMDLSRKMKAAFNICCPSGELSELEIAKAQFYLAVRSIIYKQTIGNAPDTEIMNRHVEKMVEKAISCTGIENIVDADKSIDLFSEDFVHQLDEIKLPISKFNALLKLLRKAITAYKRTNKVKALEFDEMLKLVIEKYNNRDNLTFAGDVFNDFMDELSDELIRIYKGLKQDQSSFESLGITYEEKTFYDILVKVRDDHEFSYDDEKCIMLAKKIKELVDDKSQFADWLTRDDIKNQLDTDLTVLLYNNGYPPEWNEEVYAKVMGQAENYKKYS